MQVNREKIMTFRRGHIRKAYAPILIFGAIGGAIVGFIVKKWANSQALKLTRSSAMKSVPQCGSRWRVRLATANGP